MFFVCLARVRGDDFLPAAGIRRGALLGRIGGIELDGLRVIPAEMECVDDDFFEVPWGALKCWVV